MKTFSRWMPPAAVKPVPLWAKAVLWICLAAWVAWVPPEFIRHPRSFVLLAVGVAAYLVCDRVRHRRLNRIAEARQGEDIGTFARAFDRRSPHFDPWVVRATWQALTPWVQPNLPVRPTDSLSLFGMELAEDVEDILEEVAERTGRSLDAVEANPYWGRVRTVGDIVEFVSHQPRRPAA